MEIQMKLGFVGTGAITAAMVTGLQKADPDEYAILLSPRNAEVAARLARTYPQVRVAASNQAVLDGSDLVVLAVRPQIASDVLSELRFRTDHQVISVIATLPLAAISALVAPATRIVRAVPVPAVAERRGATAIFPPDHVAAQLFDRLGTAIEVEAAGEFDAFWTATATFSCYFAFSDAVADWLARHGVPPGKARAYVGGLFHSLAEAAVAAPEHGFASLAREYATRGGLNEQLLAYLTDRGVFAEMAKGLDVILRRVEGGGAARPTA
jgi:pyrroline-5-carboxylate reductase